MASSLACPVTQRAAALYGCCVAYPMTACPGSACLRLGTPVAQPARRLNL